MGVSLITVQPDKIVSRSSELLQSSQDTQNSPGHMVVVIIMIDEDNKRPQSKLEPKLKLWSQTSPQ
jgi:hypothetical protein